MYGMIIDHRVTFRDIIKYYISQLLQILLYAVQEVLETKSSLPQYLRKMFNV